MLINAYDSLLSNGKLLKACRYGKDMGCGGYYELHLVSYALIATNLISQVWYPSIIIFYD